MKSQFFMVVSSLPRIGPSYKIEKTPISRLQLEKRLNLLPEHRAKLLFTIEQLVWLSMFEPSLSVTQIRKIYLKVLNENNLFIQNLVQWYLDIRSIIAAVRIKNENKECPQNPHDYWVTKRAKQIMRKWNEPDFGLKAVYPWLLDIVGANKKQDNILVEEFLLDHIWQYLSRMEVGHNFDFEALVIYLLRWDVIYYWSGFNKEEVVVTINALGEQLLKELANGRK